MFEKLKKLCENAYTPYSHFNVAAILVSKDGREFNGVNVENASYGAGICAERTALTGAMAAGCKRHDFKELHVLCGDSNKISTCCFICRQVISELCDKDMPIICYDKTGNFRRFTVSEMCPYPFDDEDLK